MRLEALAFYEGYLKNIYVYLFLPSFIDEISILLGLSVSLRICCCFQPILTLSCSFISFGDKTWKRKDEFCARGFCEDTKQGSFKNPLNYDSTCS